MLLRKGVYPYELMDHWKQHYLKKEVNSNLNMEEIVGADYMHGKRVCKDFEIKNLVEYHDFYVVTKMRNQK